MQLPIWLRTTLSVYKNLKDPGIEIITTGREGALTKVSDTFYLGFPDILVLLDKDKVYQIPVFHDREVPYGMWPLKTVNVLESRIDKMRAKKIQVNPFEFEPDEELLEKFVFHSINGLFKNYLISDKNHEKIEHFMFYYLLPGIPNREKIFSPENLKQKLHPSVLEIFVVRFILIDNRCSKFLKKPESLSELKEYINLISDETLFKIIYYHSDDFIGRDTVLEKDDLEAAKKLADAINKAYFASKLLTAKRQERKLDDLVEIIQNTIPPKEVNNLISKELLNKIRKSMVNCF